MSESRRTYHWPIKISQTTAGIDDVGTVWNVEGRNQAEMLPNLPKALLAAYAALRGQVTHLSLRTHIQGVGTLELFLMDSRHNTTYNPNKAE